MVKKIALLLCMSCVCLALDLKSLWTQHLHNLSLVKDYVIHIDCSLINSAMRYIESRITAPLTQKESDELFCLIEFIAEQPSFSDGSALSRFNTTAKVQLFTLLEKNETGRAFLKQVRLKNARIAAELEALN